MPDWKNIKDYAYCMELSPEGWAWEFLRRGSDYREDYELAMVMEKEDKAKYGERPKFFTPLNKEIPHRSFYIPPKRQEESLDAWIQRCNTGSIPPERLSPLLGYGRKWKLKNHIQNPKIDTPPEFAPEAKAAKLLRWREIEEQYTATQKRVSQRTDRAIISFDLNHSVETLIEEATKLLQAKQKLFKEKQSNPKTAQLRKLIDYLRILDAKAQAARPSLIASTLYPTDDQKSARVKVSNGTNTAEEYTNIRYINCLTMNRN